MKQFCVSEVSDQTLSRGWRRKMSSSLQLAVATPIFTLQDLYLVLELRLGPEVGSGRLSVDWRGQIRQWTHSWLAAAATCTAAHNPQLAVGTLNLVQHEHYAAILLLHKSHLCLWDQIWTSSLICWNNLFLCSVPVESNKSKMIQWKRFKSVGIAILAT